MDAEVKANAGINFQVEENGYCILLSISGAASFATIVVVELSNKVVISFVQ